VLNFSDAANSLNGTLPITSITLGQGGAVESIRVHYNGTSTPKRGHGRANEITNNLQPGEYITEVYFKSDTSYKLVFGLLFRTNTGRYFGAGSRFDSTMIRAFPCPVGQYRLAFISGIVAGTGKDSENVWTAGDLYLFNLMFYWAPVSADGKEVANVVYTTNQALCDAPPPSPPPAPPARAAPAGRHWLLCYLACHLLFLLGLHHDPVSNPSTQRRYVLHSDQASTEPPSPVPAACRPGRNGTIHRRWCHQL
jgi:hypothetical protein